LTATKAVRVQRRTVRMIGMYCIRIKLV
jgi:hypothetical protein